jgi:hypothetical protein
MSEQDNGSQEEQEERGKVFVGFHPFGGIKLEAENVRLSPQEAFVLAGQLNAHANMLIQQEYVEQAMATKMAQDKGIVIPGR